MAGVLIAVQIFLLFGGCLVTCNPVDGHNRKGRTVHRVVPESPENEKLLRYQANHQSMSPIAESIANAQRVVHEIPDTQFQITVIKPSKVEEKEFTVQELAEEEAADSTNFSNKIDDYNLGPNASF